MKANVNDASNTVDGLSLCRFYRKEVVSASNGEAIYSLLLQEQGPRPNYQLKISLVEAEALKVKLDYMIKAIKDINENPSARSISSIAVADAIREAYHNDVKWSKLTTPTLDWFLMERFAKKPRQDKLY